MSTSSTDTVRIDGQDVPVERLARLRSTAIEWQGYALAHLEGDEWGVEAMWQTYLLYRARDEWGQHGTVGKVLADSWSADGRLGEYQVQLCKGSVYVDRWITRDHDELLAADRAIDAWLSAREGAQP